MPKACAHCGAELKRKRHTNGALEARESFARRKFCDRRCMARAMGRQEQA